MVKKVSRNLVKYYKFPGFDENDLLQEAAIIGLAALKDFDQDSGDVEKFLYVVIKNGLHNLKQKHYYNNRITSDYMESKKKVVGFVSSKSEKTYDHPFEELEIQEIEMLIDRFLHPHMKEDYNKLKEGFYIATQRRRDILNEVRRIYNMIEENKVADLEQQLQNWKTR